MAETDSRCVAPVLRWWRRALFGPASRRFLLSAALLSSRPSHGWSLRSSAGRLLHHIYLGAILQLLEAAIRHHLAWIQSGHLGKIVVGRSRGDVPDLRGTVLNHPNKRLGAVVLNC